ncbi:MAG: hypothetical protein JXR68_03230, partial [Bacteroidales bacterium]|nr:hypothetical protein [Bacteroidales bacterium]
MNKLFSEFDSVKTQDWLEIIKKDLKGADIKKLMRKTIDGLYFEPFYRKENTENLSTINSLPNQFPFLRGYKENNDWLIRQDFLFENIQKAGKDAKKASKKNVNLIAFDFGEKFNLSETDFSKLIESSNNIAFNAFENIEEAYFLLQKQKIKLNFAFFNYDPITYKTFTGNHYKEMKETWDNVGKMLKNEQKGVKTIGINLHHFANAGATPVMQLAFGLSIAAEYMNFATETKIPLKNVIDNLFFNIAFSCDYFMEISKVRAFRYLFAKLIEGFDSNLKNEAKTFIHGITTRRNKTIYDAHVNMLRTTIEMLAGVVGGVDSFTTEPFNSVFANPNEFSHRIAVNQQFVIKEEAYTDKVADPSGGSYYVENLTVKLIDEAWKLFLEIEEKGGYCDALKNNFIADLIEEIAQKENNLVETGKIAILGTNKYPNQTENLSKLNVNKPIDISDIKHNNTHFKTLKINRLAEKFEDLRMKTEKSENIPVVFLFTYGNKSMRRARADFAGNFFAVAGFKVIDNLGFDEIETGISKANESNADIIVLCSSD